MATHVNAPVDEPVDSPVPHSPRSARSLLAVRLGCPLHLQRGEIGLRVRHQHFHQAEVDHCDKKLKFNILFRVYKGQILERIAKNIMRMHKEK